MFQNGRMFNGGCSDKEYNRLVLKTIGGVAWGLWLVLGILMTPYFFWLYVACAVFPAICWIYSRFIRKKQPPKEEEKE